MRRLYFLILLVVCGLGATAQPYNNEWIDPAKTYFKFPIRTSQLCRIPKATLVTYGLGDVPAEQFQLWRDGQQVPMYTTEATGPLSATGYLEFFGKMNDGLKDSVLYPEKWYQPNASRSLFSDTSWYFLTINQGGPNKRLVQTANNVASTTLPADSFFNCKRELLFPQGFTEGYGVFVSRRNDTVEIDRDLEPGEIIRSSTFDRGEGWYYSEFRKSAPNNLNFGNLNIFKRAPSVTVEYKASGYKSAFRNVLLYLNDSLIGTTGINEFEMANPTFQNIPLSRFTNNGNNALVKFTTDLDDPYFWLPDRVFLHSLVLSYQHTFRFNYNLYNNLSYFEFNLPANTNGNHLRIASFRNDGVTPVLYDFTNLKRYVGQIKTDTSMFLLDPSSVDRNLVIVSQQASRVLSITTLKEMHYTNYAQVSNQADYLIVSSKRLYDYNGHNYVEDYRAYRNSILGGSYNAKTFEIDELADQFAFGIRKHPLAVKNFIRYAHDQFSTEPKAVFLIGKGSRYIDYRVSPFVEKDLLNVIPTYGLPASDNLLASENNINMTPLIPIGRLSAVNGQEVSNYLQKVKEFEAVSNFTDQTVENKEWKKEVLQLNGVDDSYFSQAIDNFFAQFSNILSDSLFGARVKTFTKVNNPHFASDMLSVSNRIKDGVGYINFFGESSSNSLNFGLDNPNDYENSNGKYPVITALGCFVGNIFDFDGVRLGYTGRTVSDRYIFTPKKGALAFISNSGFGYFNYLTLYMRNWSTSLAKTQFGKSLGHISQEAIKSTINTTPTLQDFYNRVNCEQTIFHGDPAIVMNPVPKPDHVITDSLISIDPVSRTVAEDSLLVKVRYYNIGGLISDSVGIEIKREYPDGRSETLVKKMVTNVERIKSVRYGTDSVITSLVENSITIPIAVKGQFEKGTNYIIATIDPDNLQDEISESNNIGKLAFEVIDEEIRPVYPYNYAIVNQPGFLFTGSSVNAVQETRTYRMQIDTTENFNSPLLLQFDTVSLGGAVNFNPAVTWTNGRVYYWRLAPVINGQAVNWRSSSFQYLQGTDPGFGQSHFYQHTHSDFEKISLDTDRLLHFEKSVQSLFIRNSIYQFSGFEDSHFSITVNGDQTIRSACVGRSIIFNVFDTLSFKPWDNSAGNRFGSGPNCDYYRRLNFEFSYVGSANRKKMMDFLDSIPKGLYVTARMILDGDYYANGTTYFDSSFVKYWQRDTLKFGAGNSLYHSLFRQGFYDIDSINNQPKTFIFIFKKSDSSSFKPISRVSQGLYDRIDKSIFPETIDSLGTITSPVFGPAKTWKEMHWMGHQYPGINPESEALVELIGIDKDSNQTLLKIFSPSQWVNDISNINAAQFPYLQLRLKTKNAVKAIPYQLDYWRLFYEPVPDGALSARDHYVFSGPILLTAKDSLKIELAFKNISKTPLAPTNAVIKIGDRNGIIGTYPLNQLKALASQDTAIISFKKETNGMSGKYYALIEVNKEQNPLEQFTFNNSTYLPFEVVTSLPTSVINFNAIAENNNSSLLTWNVTNEQDVKTYVLEHGTTTSNLTFLKEMAAKNINTTSNYSWVHTKPVIGVNYYRLKTIYTSGNIEYAPIRKVVFSKNGSINIYPNPFRDKIWVTVTGNKQWNMELYNASGQIIMTKKGAGNQSINTQSLPAGLYLARISCDGEIQSMKLEKHSQ